MDLLIFFLISIAGWLGFQKLRLPAPTILGPIVILGITGFFGMHITVPFWLKPILSVIMGTFLGLRFNLKLKGMVKQIFLVGSWIIMASLLTAKVLVYLGLSEATAVFAAMPGGLVELTLVAMSFGASTFTIALLQSSRLFLTMLIIPFIIKKLPVGTPADKQPAGESITTGWQKWLGVIIIAVVSALVLGMTGMPASSLIGPILGVGIYTKMLDAKFKVNRKFQNLVQVGVGGLIGLNATRETILGIADFIVPILTLNVLIIGSSLILGFLLHKTTGWDLATCLLSTAPAGLTPMILLSVELNADSNRVVVFQVLRLVTVVLFAPFGAQIFLA